MHDNERAGKKQYLLLVRRRSIHVIPDSRGPVFILIWTMLSPVFTPFPTLRTSRLTLRQLKETDAEEVLFLRSDAQVQQYVNRPLLTSLKEATE